MLITGKKPAPSEGAEREPALDAPGKRSASNRGPKGKPREPATGTGIAQRQVMPAGFSPPHGVLMRKELTDFSTWALQGYSYQLAGLSRHYVLAADHPVRLAMTMNPLDSAAGHRPSLGIAAKRYQSQDPAFSAAVKHVAEAEARYGKDNDAVEIVELAPADAGPIQLRLRDLLLP
ncbi:MAG TPA: hypothetical protein VF800_26575 [Telluria sp.]|jgi:hypothetical protein